MNTEQEKELKVTTPMKAGAEWFWAIYEGRFRVGEIRAIFTHKGIPEFRIVRMGVDWPGTFKTFEEAKATVLEP